MALPSPPPPPSGPPTLLAVALPAAGGLILGQVADASALGALLLLLEPVAVVAGTYLVLAALSSRRLVLAGATAAGWALGVGALHLPVGPIPPPDHRPEWTHALRTCAEHAGAVEGPVRLVQWRLDGDPELDPADVPAHLGFADVAVLHGAPSTEVGAALARAWAGEAKHYPGGPDDSGGLTVVVRGAFQYCGGTEDSWAVDLPAADGHAARVVLTFPKVDGVGAFPLLAVHMDPAHGPTSWPAWPRRLAESGRVLAALARAVGPDRMVLAGDLAAPPTFRHLAGRLQGGGLHEVRVPPSWPARIGPLPALPVHRLDRVWVGDAWQGEGPVLRRNTGHARAPVAITLLPTVVTAR